MAAPPYPPINGREPCRTGDPNRFHPERGDNVSAAQAKQECLICHVREDCLAFALKAGMTGIWGGTSEDERNGIRRRLGISVRRLDRVGLDTEQVLRMSGRGTRPRDIADFMGFPIGSIHQVIGRAAREAS